MGRKSVDAGAGFFRRARVFLICLAAAGGSSPSPLAAIGILEYRTASEDALGVSGGLAAVFFDADHRAEGRWMLIEAGRRELFGIEHLTIDGFRLGRIGRRWGVVLSSATLTSPIGGETRIAVEPLAVRNRQFGIAARIAFDSLRLVGYRGAALLSGSVRACARLSERLLTGYAVDNVRVAGEEIGGADLSLFLFARASRSLGVVASVMVARGGGAGAGVAARIALGRRVTASVGYDDPTGLWKGAFSAGTPTFAVEAGASLHPVLGLSKSVFVSWRP